MSRFRWTGEIDARVLALEWGGAKKLAAELGVSVLSVRSRKKRLLALSDGRARMAATERAETKDQRGEFLFRRRMPGWLLTPVEKSVENPAKP